MRKMVEMKNQEEIRDERNEAEQRDDMNVNTDKNINIDIDTNINTKTNITVLHGIARHCTTLNVFMLCVEHFSRCTVDVGNRPCSYT